MTAKRTRVGTRVSVFVGASLDGFIARENGDLDWMQGPSDPGAGPTDYGYEAFIARIDALVMGRETFEKVLTFNEWPYGEKPVIVLTHRPVRIPARVSRTVEAMAGSPEEIVDRLNRRGLRRIYVDGGRTIQGFLASGMVDELIVSRLPVLIGQGIRLFGPLPTDVRLSHVQTRTFPGGMVQSAYEVEQGVPGRLATPGATSRRVENLTE